VLQLDAEVVWSWVMGEIAKPAAVQELLLSLALQVKRLPMHVPVLAGFEAVAKLQIAFATVPKLSTLPEDVVKVIHWNCTRSLGASADLMCSFLNRFWRLRAQARRVGHQCPPRQILLHYQSDLLQLRDGTGLFAGLSADERADALRTYIDDAIMLRGNEVGVIDDGNIPRHLFDHFRKFDAVFILDVDHLYKVHRGGLLRTTCEASDDIRRAFIANEAAMLWGLKRYVTHGWTKNAMIEAMMRFMPR
jgi:hypothetical protein